MIQNKPLKEKTCKSTSCKKKFKPERPLQMVCDYKCAGAYKIQQQQKKQQYAWREERKEVLEKLKTLSDYKKDLEREINPIARLIDRHCPCISCKRNGKPQAGHYHTVKANDTLRFNLHNIHIQDYHCNVKLSSNITGYNLGLIDWYGKMYQEYVEYGLVKEYPYLGLTKEDIKRAIIIARECRKSLEKCDEIHTPAKRIEMRTYYNTIISIYK